MNVECGGYDDKPFEWALRQAVKLGCGYVEHTLRWEREMLSCLGTFTASQGRPASGRARRQGLSFPQFTATHPCPNPKLLPNSGMGPETECFRDA